MCTPQSTTNEQGRSEGESTDKMPGSVPVRGRKVQGVDPTVQGGGATPPGLLWPVALGRTRRGLPEEGQIILMTRLRRSVVVLAMTTVLVATLVSVVARSAAAATPVQLNLNVLLIGTASPDPTTAAWQSALSSEGVAYTSVTASGSYGAETVLLPALTTGSVGNFNGVVLADSPSAFAVGQLSALDTYESSYGVRQVDGYMYPIPAQGITEVSGGALTGTAQLTPAGLAALPGLKGTVPFDTGTYGYPSNIGAGAPLTPWLENAAGQVLAGVYQH